MRSARGAAAAGLIATVGAVLAGPAPAVAHAPTPCPTRSEQPQPAPSGVPWALQRYGPERLAGLATGAGVLVAVLDSGVDARHAQLVNAVKPGGDEIVPGGDGLVDCVGHGTAVASVIAARPAAGTAFRGLAPGAMILSIRVSEQTEQNTVAVGRGGNPAEVAAAIRLAVDKGARVLNLSFVLYQDDPTVHDAVRYALMNDAVVVAAAGNQYERGNRRPYPASYEGVVGVGAIGVDGRRLAGSQVGPYVDLVAPGGQIVVAALPQGQTVQEGTSIAAPHVAAAAALLRQYRPALTAGQVVERLTATADPAPGGTHSEEYGAGVLNPYRALTDELGGARTSTTASSPPPVGPQPPMIAAPRAPKFMITIGLVGLAVLVIFLAVVLPHGRRRGWRPGLRAPAHTDEPAG